MLNHSISKECAWGNQAYKAALPGLCRHNILTRQRLKDYCFASCVYIDYDESVICSSHTILLQSSFLQHGFFAGSVIVYSIATEYHHRYMASAGSEPAWRSADSPWRQSTVKTSATETPRAESRSAAPAVFVSKCNSVDVLHIDLQHSRQPDVGIGIRVEIHAAKYARAQEYYGEYIGHGLTKTAFLLRRSARDQTGCVDAPEHVSDYDGKVLKLSKNRDVEPEVFRQAYKLAVTTSILLESDAIDTDTNRNYHCWITDRCIPLNQLCDQYNINKSSCSIGAYYCLLRAAVGNFYISDCGFQNLGLVVN